MRAANMKNKPAQKQRGAHRASSLDGNVVHATEGESRIVGNRGQVDPTQIKKLQANATPFRLFVERRGIHKSDAEDIVQTALLKAVERSAEIQNPSSLFAWVYQILRNAVADHHRSFATRRRILTQAAQTSLAVDVVAPDKRIRPCTCLYHVLKTLSPEHAELLRKVDLGGVTIGEVSAESSMTPNYVRVRLYRARKALRKALEHHCGPCSSSSCLDCWCGR